MALAGKGQNALLTPLKKTYLEVGKPDLSKFKKQVS